MTEEKKSPLEEKGAALKKQMKIAAQRDMNPFRKGYDQELLSLLAPHFPEVDRLSPLTLYFTEDSWLSADSLLWLADLGERYGSSLIEILTPENKINLLCLTPEAKDNLWNSLARSEKHHVFKDPGPNIGRCPFWGPCLGGRENHYGLFLELTEELAPEMTDDFRIEIVGCPRDCRLALERCDLGLVLEDDGLEFSLWLGGRHRNFYEAPSPFEWQQIKIEDFKRLTFFVYNVHDLWKKLALPSESLYELTERIGFSNFETLALENS
jgi:dissimilatory sulfite reductase (desulfoviridin) alpha/beta subunit